MTFKHEKLLANLWLSLDLQSKSILINALSKLTTINGHAQKKKNRKLVSSDSSIVSGILNFEGKKR